MVARNSFNSKRRVQADPVTPENWAHLAEIAGRVRYVGSPLHKRNPADFGLQPPASPRQGKTLCDGAVDRHVVAQHLLETAVRKGLVSLQVRNGWPQNVWAVTDSGVALEAQLDNEQLGTYHGYPMTHADPLREQVVLRWGQRP